MKIALLTSELLEMNSSVSIREKALSSDAASA
jgi:hypothetical protein